MKFDIMANDQRYLKFFWSLIIQGLLEQSTILGIKNILVCKMIYVVISDCDGIQHYDI